VVEFSPAGGSPKIVQMPEGSWPPAYEIGDPVTVLYDPQQPLNARVKSTSGTVSLWIWTMVTGILAAAFIGATFLARWVLKEVPDVKEPADEFFKDKQGK
jgi:hypothetical protein